VLLRQYRNRTLRLGNAAGSDAAGANPHAFGGLADHDVDALQIGIPSPFRQIVGMTYSVPVHRAFITDFTTSHERKLLTQMKQKYNT
jgi:hypothetical protein